MKWLTNLLDVPVVDPDDARRRKLLNVLLLGVGALSCLAVIATFVFADMIYEKAFVTTRWSTIGAVSMVALTFVLNRYGPSWLAVHGFWHFFSSL